MPEWDRLSACLDRLVPHLRMRDVAMTGGVAIDIGLARHSLLATRSAIADLDFVASALDAVAPGIAGDFLVSHYHAAGPGVPKFIVQVVDPRTRIRVDIFPDLAGSIAGASAVRIGAHVVHVLSLEAILDHKLQTLGTASPARPVDPKHARDARTIAGALGRAIPDVPSESLREDVYAADADDCTRCALSLNPLFPLAPQGEIARLLGWPAKTCYAAGAAMSPAELTVRKLGDVIVVEPGAAIHLCESDLLPLVTGFLEQGFRKFVLNLQMVEYMDSAMLGGIAQSHGFASRRGGRFVLCCCVPRLLRLFDTTKLSGVFQVADSEEAALSGFVEPV